MNFHLRRCSRHWNPLMPYFVAMTLLSPISLVISTRYHHSPCGTSPPVEDNCNMIPSDLECLRSRYEILIDEIKDLAKEYEELAQMKSMASTSSDREDMLSGISEKLSQTRGELAAIKAKTLEIVKDIAVDMENVPSRTVVRMVGSVPVEDFQTAYKQRFLMHSEQMGDLYQDGASMSENIVDTMGKVNIFISHHKWTMEKGVWHIVREPERLAEFRSKLGEEIYSMIYHAIDRLDVHQRNSDIDPSHEFASYMLVNSATGVPVPFGVAISDFQLYLRRYKTMLETCDCNERVAIMHEDYLRTRPWLH